MPQGLTAQRLNQIAPLTFMSKAKTLRSLHDKIKCAVILPVYVVDIDAWKKNPAATMAEFNRVSWSNEAVVVRSSAANEDCHQSSMAGHFTSIINVAGTEKIMEAINTVIASYETNDESNEVLIQPFLNNVVASGVAFTRDPNTNAPYYVINYDDTSGKTDTITGGTHGETKCHIWHKYSKKTPNGFLADVIGLLNELEMLYHSDLIDIEFAYTKENQLYLFQARPLVINELALIEQTEHKKAIERIATKINLSIAAHPFLHGKRTIYGVMPDWNPAEIVGIRPKPLALSLYRELVTDSVWAYQRDNYGYKNLRSFPLLVDFEGLPYVDVRVSFNSFIPKSINSALSEKLVNYYIERLTNSPSLHDKVEFEIIFSCYTLDLKQRLELLDNFDFSKNERDIIFNELTSLTKQIIRNKDGYWKSDLEKIEILKARQLEISSCNLDPISKMYWLLEDCKRYGTLPFAGLARAAFIAVQLLKSFVSTNIISHDDYSNFFLSLDTVSSLMSNDFGNLSRDEFLSKYGHLRPGTYDINSPRYDEAPDSYFNWQTNNKSHDSDKLPSFSLNINQLRAIQQHIDNDKLDTSVLNLLEFIKSTIEGREYAKFVFSKNISEFMSLLIRYADSFGFSREDCSYIDLQTIQSLYCTSSDPKEILEHSIALGKKRFAMTQSIALPPLICNPDDVWDFSYPETTPNFITQKTCEGRVVFVDSPKDALNGGILMIPSADPGYDWIFSHQIAGFITQFGGVNSHMAIRAGELGIPAIIGAGETNFQKWSKATRLHINTTNRQVFIL